MNMNIESRLPDITRFVQTNTDTGTVENRRVGNTSRPDENLDQKPLVARFVTSNANERPNTLRTVTKTIDVKEAVEKINEFVRSQQKYVNFSIDEATNSPVIKVYKTQTGELLKQIPAEEILALAAKLRKNIGWLVDSTV